jgi:hypothetical protein
MKMERDELDRIMLETEIMPSSGFTASVMDAVRSEAAAPPPIPFPWKWALPGLAVGGVTLGMVLVITIAQLARGPAVTAIPTDWITALHSVEHSTMRFGGLWIALALFASFACVKFSRLFVARSA